MDAQQIDMDVARCTWHLLSGTQRSQRLQMEHKRHKPVARFIQRQQERLAVLINTTLLQSYAQTPEPLRYYQGYHDIACIFLSTLPTPAPVLGRMSQSHLYDNLQAHFGTLQETLRQVLFPLVALVDPPVHDHLMQANMEPFFALSWIITWFAHDVRDTDLVKRIFDAFLSGHEYLPLYVTIAMLVRNRAEILATECDFALLHQTLVRLPRNSSMVGWKYRPGDGYVSEDDDDDDDDSVQSVEADFRFQAELLEHKVPGEAGTESSAVSSANRVPFDELIDLALVYMDRIPPRRLNVLASRYYGQPMEPMGRPPASWTTAATFGDLPLSMSCEEPDDWQVIRERQTSPAVIAAGFGKGDDERRRRRRRRRRRLLLAGVTVAVVVVAMYWQYRRNARPLDGATTRESVPPAVHEKPRVVAKPEDVVVWDGVAHNVKDTVAEETPRLSFSSAMQARASEHVSKLGGRLEEAYRHVEPRARDLASKAQKRTTEWTQRGHRFLVRGDAHAVAVADYPRVLSLQSHAQARIHNEIGRLGDLLGHVLKPHLSKARAALSDESAHRVRHVMGALAPLVELLNKPYGDSSDDEL